MNRDNLEAGLKRAGVSLNGWLPVMHCDTCNKLWEPFAVAVDGPSAPTARLDYWVCPNKCNADAQVDLEIKTVIPRYVMINDVPGMIFDDEDLEEFERYVRSMDVTQIFNR
ncbi:MAG TPA: hypothetical protein VN644_14435 [Pyrinomonadaceae bacterium]|jgi:hypothetical protein|nr:hypothetical protein [Pyrinomonadaceae bacterium]